ncbi:WD40 domain-containing protein [Cephalotus follicularis]|uniref:WD40 domain-containing protein n=1 Tax=Cephalotus follicularis TaxID=3775 RepID=A0A1Q3D287_CEPFO|nr:WD40 domain-containing protein [Cephalotus follicularis]
MNHNKKRSRSNLDKAIVDVWQREVGQLSTRNFANRLGASEDLLLRLDLYKKLDKHKGCVNTVSFNADGDILVSGSDDRRVILWHWETGSIKLSFHSGHYNNVFQAKIMPYTDDRSIVTCAADGQVRHAQISERGVVTAMLAKHEGRAHKLAIEPGSPHIFYTCGEDGLVQHFDLRTRAATELFTCHPIDDRRSYMPVIHLNAIAIDPRNPNLFAVAGSDEYTRLYDIRKYEWDGSSDFGQPADYFCPPHLIGDEQVGITGLAFSDLSELLVSYNDEFIYLFTKDMGLGPNPGPSSPFSTGIDTIEVEQERHSAASPSTMGTEEKVASQVYKGHRNCETVKGVNFLGPKCEYVVSGSDCGRIFIWKKKGGELIRVIEADKHVVNCIESHPHTMVLASSGIEKNIKIWTPKAIERATLPKNIEQVFIPGRIHCFAIGHDDDDDDAYFYYDDVFDYDDEEDNDEDYYDDDDVDDDDDDEDDAEEDDNDDNEFDVDVGNEDDERDGDIDENGFEDGGNTNDVVDGNGSMDNVVRSYDKPNHD